MSEFYVGYLPQAPSRLAKFVRITILGTFALTVSIAILLAVSQAPFLDSRFEYLQYRPHEGIIVARPYPTLRKSDGSSYLLVRTGKHGASDLFEQLDGRSVRVQGALIESGRQRMLEIIPTQTTVLGNAKSIPPSSAPSLRLTLTGEIVDSKCYFGVMNPGNGKTHRSCAARCISGGIPPAFLVRDSAGELRTFLLADAAGRPLNHELLDYVAEPVQLQGELLGATFFVDPASLRRVRE